MSVLSEQPFDKSNKDEGPCGWYTANDFKLVLLGKELAPVPSVKDLGLLVDSTLSFDEHIAITVSSCMTSLVQIYRVNHLLDGKTLENVTNALVFSKLFYCCTVWSGTSTKNVKK